MKRIKVWLSKKGLKNKRTLTVVIASVLFIIFLFLLLSSNSEDSRNITTIENVELCTGPNAAHPVIHKVEKGDHFKKIGKVDKWIEAEDTSSNEEGQIAGRHTNLDIIADNMKEKNPLQGKTIVLDPGHGGSDQGASSNIKHRSLEKDYTLKTAKELQRTLEKENATVKMTRTDDTYVSLENRDIRGDAYLSIHNNALESSSVNGMTVCQYHDNQRALADTLDATIQKKGLFPNRGLRQENYQVLRQIRVPAVLLELGYTSNPTDETIIKDQLHRQTLEQAIVDGLKIYFSAWGLQKYAKVVIIDIEFYS